HRAAKGDGRGGQGGVGAQRDRAGERLAAGRPHRTPVEGRAAAHRQLLQRRGPDRPGEGGVAGDRQAIGPRRGGVHGAGEGYGGGGQGGVGGEGDGAAVGLGASGGDRPAVEVRSPAHRQLLEGGRTHRPGERGGAGDGQPLS